MNNKIEWDQWFLWILYIINLYRSLDDHSIISGKNDLLHGVCGKWLQMIDCLRPTHQRLFMLRCLMNDLFDVFLPHSIVLNKNLKKFSQNSLSVNTVHQQIIKFLSNFFQLGWTLLFDDELADVPDLFFVGSKHAFRSFGISRSLKLNQGWTKVPITIISYVLVCLLSEDKVIKGWRFHPAYFWKDLYNVCLFWSGNAKIEASWPDWTNELMNIVANEDHSAVLDIFFHCSSEPSLSIFCELICFIYD